MIATVMWTATNDKQLHRITFVPQAFAGGFPMGVIAIAVRHLIAAGVTGDALVTAIEQLEAASPTIPDSRSAAAKRQERYRNRHKPSQTVTTVTVEASEATTVTDQKPLQVDQSRTVTNRNGVTPCDAMGGRGESSFLPSLRDSGKEDLEIQHARDVREAVALFNAMAQDCGLPQAQHINDDRRKKIRKRLAECGGIAGWKAALDRVRASPGLQGKAGGNWRADLDFMLQASSFTKLMEGKYDHWKKPQTDLMAAADRLRERSRPQYRADAQGGGSSNGFADAADRDRDLLGDSLSY